MISTIGTVFILFICDPSDHEWTDEEDCGDGTKWQICDICGKRRRVSGDTP